MKKKMIHKLPITSTYTTPVNHNSYGDYLGQGSSLGPATKQKRPPATGPYSALLVCMGIFVSLHN